MEAAQRIAALERQFVSSRRSPPKGGLSPSRNEHLRSLIAPDRRLPSPSVGS